MTGISADLVARRRGRDPYEASSFGWYGADPVFQLRVERGMKSIAGIAEPVNRNLGRRALRYTVTGLEVPGDLERHDVSITFQRDPLPDMALGIAPCDFPKVFTSVERPRNHVHGDGALCLWATFDPPERRWWHGDGLGSLVEIIRTHLLLELHWWRTTVDGEGEWAVDDAPHGVPDDEVLR